MHKAKIRTIRFGWPQAVTYIPTRTVTLQQERAVRVLFYPSPVNNRKLFVTQNATKHGSWKVKTFRLLNIWKTDESNVDKIYNKITLPSVFNGKQANHHIPLPHPTQCCFLGNEQFPVKHHFPHQHCIRGRGGGRSNCGRIKKGETVSEWFFGCLCSVVIA